MRICSVPLRALQVARQVERFQRLSLPAAQVLPSRSLSAQQSRWYSAAGAQPPRKNFLSNLVDNIKEEMAKNKELEENKRQLDQRLKELNDSDALKDARRKFDLVEKETLKNSEVITQKLEELKDQIGKMVAEVQKTEAGKKLTAAGEATLKQARAAAEQIEKAAEKVGNTEVYKQASKTVKAVKEEIDEVADVRMYSRPETLKMRSEGFDKHDFAAKTFEPNTEATGIELHKESKWYAGWKKFSEENTYYNKVLDWKIRYDESENIAVRLMRGVTEKIGSVFSGSNEVSEVLTEIHKVDPSFDKIEWLRFCEKEVIPNILEAFIRGEMEVLEDWCYERAFNTLAAVVKEYQKIGFTTQDCRIIDVSKVEMVSGKMMEQGPVIIINFQAFMINVVKNSEGKVVQGDPNKPVRVHHVWVMCRDMEEYNPARAWKLLEVHMQQGDLAV
ncbi:hypothetical protein QR680_007430 [Steinernema hermaphroditum]|uniref:Mitochondrial import inner membrane translocase subunit TIM44 n=1 Tax=Steinernema hermaphroditum TaxID=289476 RepID=A0AA39IEK9_9BILA|nr:hypothetical protein QR680_007430 [Steinernema hermaphroditum]